MKIILTSDLHYGCAPNNANKLNKFFQKLANTVKEEKVDLVILAGDLASTRQRQFKKCLELANTLLPCNIAVVRGNHDLWDGEDRKDDRANCRTYAEMDNEQKAFMKTLGIHHLEEGPMEFDDVLICGFDGWYGNANPPTNDKYWMPQTHEGCPIMTYLSNRAWKYFDKCLELDTSKYRKSVIVTHFNPYIFGKGYRGYVPDPEIDFLMSANPKFLDEIRGKFDVLCCGHTHAFKDDIDESGDKPLRILNSGSDNNQPKYLLFEV